MDLFCLGHGSVRLCNAMRGAVMFCAVRLGKVWNGIILFKAWSGYARRSLVMQAKARYGLVMSGEAR